MDTTIQARIPEQLLRLAEAMIAEGWSADLDSLVAEALRRYLESHRTQLTEKFFRDDMRWGLRGDD